MTTPPQRTAPLSAPILTQQDVERLLADPSADSRISILEHVSSHYNVDSFKPREREIAEQIFRLLMKDVELTVRETLSERIQHNGSIPRDIILHISEDVASVSLPVLANSTVFSDADLVAIVEAHNELSRLLAISRRTQVSARVSDALVDTSHPQVVSSLLANDAATVSPHAFEKIVDEFHAESEVMQAMTQRNHLPMAVVERLVHEASSAVAEQLRQKYQLTDQQLANDATHAREDILLYLLTHPVEEKEMHTLITQMHQKKRLTSSLVMAALCRGQLSFFTLAMATLVGIPAENAKRLLSDKGSRGFQGIYEKSGFPDSMQQAAYLVLRGVQQLEHDEAIPGSRLYANRLTERILSDVGDNEIEHLPYFMALIRQAIQRH